MGSDVDWEFGNRPGAGGWVQPGAWLTSAWAGGRVGFPSPRVAEATTRVPMDGGEMHIPTDPELLQPELLQPETELRES